MAKKLTVILDDDNLKKLRAKHDFLIVVAW